MRRVFDGRGFAREPRAEGEAAPKPGHAGHPDGDSDPHKSTSSKPPKPDGSCDWKGDAPDPELDDLAHPPAAHDPSSHPADARDWRGDEPEQHQDNLGPVCQPNSQDKQPDGQGDRVEHSEPSMVEPSTVEPSKVEPPTQDRNKPESGKRPRKKKAHAGRIDNPSSAPPRDHEDIDEPPVRDKTHSPWVDSLDQMPPSMMDKVNMGIKQTLDAATSILTPSPRKQPQSEPVVVGKARKTPTLAPETAAHFPEMYIPRPDLHADEQPSADETGAGNKKQKRERSRAEKKANSEARRRAKRERRKERREQRREKKERHRMERQWKKAGKKVGDIPAHIREGLRVAFDQRIPYDSRCDVCTKSAVSVMSSKKKDSKCTTCAKATERETTRQYLKSSKINLADLPSADRLLSLIKKTIGKETNTAGEASTGDQTDVGDDLARHIALHVQDLAANAGGADLRDHTCNGKGQPGHLGRHGLDRNGDTPTTSDGEQTSSNLYPNSDLSAASKTSEVDWWVRAVSSGELPSPRASESPHRIVTPFPSPPDPRPPFTTRDQFITRFLPN